MRCYTTQHHYITHNTVVVHLESAFLFISAVISYSFDSGWLFRYHIGEAAGSWVDDTALMKRRPSNFRTTLRTIRASIHETEQQIRGANLVRSLQGQEESCKPPVSIYFGGLGFGSRFFVSFWRLG